MNRRGLKKIFCVVFILWVLAPMVGSPAFGLESEQTSSWAEEEVLRGENRNLIPESLASQSLKEAMTREEFAGVIMAMWREETNREVTINEELPFLDTTDSDVIQAWKLGVVNGVGENFYQPEAPLNRQTAATMMSRLYEKFLGEPIYALPDHYFADHWEIDGWAQDAVYFMASRDIIKGMGDQQFDPKGNLTREQGIILALRMLEELFRSNSAFAPSLDYYSGMTVHSMSELREVLGYAQYHLMPSIALTMSPDLEEEIDSVGADLLMHTEIRSMSYTYGTIHQQFRCFLEYSKGGEVIALTLNPQLDYTRVSDEALDIYGRLEEILSEILSPGMKAYERERAIHDYVVENHSYDQRAELNPEKYADAYSLSGLLNNGTGVCQGYAELFCALSLNADIYCDIVYGSASGGGHAWNMVGIYGEYYHVDTTWNDPVPDGGSRVSYQYYNVDDEKMKKDHQWDFNQYPSCDYVTYLGKDIR
ncbi:MAG: transglutaminase domain-containing protein [Anaerovoracaceae bacterium]|jgi:transglutaminase-like putative cysteine protease|nr:S-layer homology domain-containing protein [Bacillota bacterium]